MLKKLGPYARPYSKWIAVGVLCSAAEAIFELLIPLVMADIVNIGIKTANQNYILQKGLLMMGMAVISLCFGLGAAASSSVAGQGFGAELRRAEYEHIQDFAFSNIEKFSTASLVTRLTNDVNNMQMTLMMGMRLLVRAPVMLVAALVLSIRLSRDLSNVFLVVIPLLLIVIVLILTKAGPLFRSLQERTDALNLVVQENLTGIRVVKSFVREDYEEEKFAKRNGDLKESSMRAFGMVVINMPVMMLVVYSTIIAVMWFGGKMVYAGTLPVGDLTAFFTYITQILMSLMMVSMMFMMMTRSIACAKRIVEVLDERPAITDDSAKADAAVKDGSIDFDHQIEMKIRKPRPPDLLPELPQSRRRRLHAAEGGEQTLQMVDRKIRRPVNTIVRGMLEITLDGSGAETPEGLRTHNSRIEQRPAASRTRMNVQPVVIRPHQSELQIPDIRRLQKTVVQTVFQKRTVVIIIIVKNKIVYTVFRRILNLTCHHRRIGFVGIAQQRTLRLPVAGETGSHRLDQFPFTPAGAVNRRIAGIIEMIIWEIITPDIRPLRLFHCTHPFRCCKRRKFIDTRLARLIPDSSCRPVPRRERSAGGVPAPRFRCAPVSAAAPVRKASRPDRCSNNAPD